MKKKKEFPVALISGGAAGVGFAIAKKFVQNKIKCVLLGPNATQLKLACEALGDLSDFIACDPEELKELPGIIHKIVEKHGQLDILVNNESTYLKKAIYDVSDNDFQKVILANQTAVFCLTREAAAAMKMHRSGAILNISSITSHFGIPGYIAYIASKSAIEGMTRAMAVELAESGIRVNCIVPGYIRTNISSHALDNDPEMKKNVLSRTPLKRMGRPSEVADAALFLVSQSASFITGVVLPVDGGISISSL